MTHYITVVGHLRFFLWESIMAKNDKKVIQDLDRDELAQSIADALNKLNKDGDQVAFS